MPNKGTKDTEDRHSEKTDRIETMDNIIDIAADYGVHPAAALLSPLDVTRARHVSSALDILTAMTDEEGEQWLALGRRLASQETLICQK